MMLNRWARAVWVAAALATPALASAATTWVEGTHYFLVQPTHPISRTSSKIEVAEVFSYACPACNAFNPIANRIRASLPANAEMTYVAAAFRADEDWPMFQKAYYAAQVLGVDRKTHDLMYDAVWKSGELSVMDSTGRRVKDPPPSLEDAAKFYAKAAGIKPETFLATARSFDVDRRVRAAEDYIRTYRIMSTPTIIVAGKYRVDAQSAGGFDQLIELIKWLVAKESHA